MNKRDDFISVLKGLGIVLVVVGHSGVFFSNKIYLFHMALFFFISGFTFKEKYLDKPWKYLKRKIIGLYKPFILWNMLFLVLHNYFVSIDFYKPEMKYDQPTFIRNLMKNIFFINTEQISGGFWFITSLFWVNVLFFLITYIIKKLSIKNKEYARFLIIITLYYLSFKILMLNFDSKYGEVKYYYNSLIISTTVLITYYLGYLYYNKYRERIKLRFIIAFICLLFLNLNSKFGEISVGANQYKSPDFFIMSSLLGIYLCLYLSKILTKTKKIKYLLMFLGDNTLIILATHMLAFKIINAVQIFCYNYDKKLMSSFPYIRSDNLWWIAYSFVGIFVPAVIKYIILKVKFKLNA